MTDVKVDIIKDEKEVSLNLLDVGDFFVYEGILYFFMSQSLDSVTAYNLSGKYAARFYKWAPKDGFHIDAPIVKTVESVSIVAKY